MNRSRKYPWLPTLAILWCLPGFAATIYKSIDENGVVTFSDTRPTADLLLETVVIDIQSAPSGGQSQQRLQDMRETTDRMAADRMAREKHRAELRQIAAQTNAQQAARDASNRVNNSPVFTGVNTWPVYRPWRPWHHPRPEHPIARPPLLPPVEVRPPNIRPLPGNDYPASLIRRHYPPNVQEAFR